MNLNSLVEKYAAELDRLAVRNGLGSRDAAACACMLAGLADALADAGAQVPAREPVKPVRHFPEDVRHGAELERDRQQVDDRIAALLGRRP